MIKFRDNTFNGEGVFMNTKGDYYFGEQENGVFNGHGIIVFNGMKS